MATPIREIDPASAQDLLNDQVKVCAGLAFYAKVSAPNLADRLIRNYDDQVIEVLFLALFVLQQAGKLSFGEVRVDPTVGIDEKRRIVHVYIELTVTTAYSAMYLCA